MTYEIIPAGPFDTNCVMLWEKPCEAWLVDPGGAAETLFNFMARRGIQPAGIVLTHGHCDHIGALDAILEAYPVPVWLREADAQWAFHPLNSIPGYYPAPPSRPAALAAAPAETELAFGGIAARVLPTPGHTPGSVCLWFPTAGLLLSGDTLFAGSVGRTDLPGGDTALLMESLRGLARLLPGETTIIPGHGPTTTLREELESNPHLDEALRNP